MNTTPHTHWCPKCERAVDCWAVHDGGCIIASASAVTCKECEWAMWPAFYGERPVPASPTDSPQLDLLTPEAA
jgi:hypothetical protein